MDGAGCLTGVKLLKLGTALHNLKLSPQKKLVKAYLETSKAYGSKRAALAKMPSRRCLFIPFMRTKSQMGQTKTRSHKKFHQREHRINIIATNLFLVFFSFVSFCLNQVKVKKTFWKYVCNQ